MGMKRVFIFICLVLSFYSSAAESTADIINKLKEKAKNSDELDVDFINQVVVGIDAKTTLNNEEIIKEFKLADELSEEKVGEREKALSLYRNLYKFEEFCKIYKELIADSNVEIPPEVLAALKQNITADINYKQLFQKISKFKDPKVRRLFYDLYMLQKKTQEEAKKKKAVNTDLNVEYHKNEVKKYRKLYREKDQFFQEYNKSLNSPLRDKVLELKSLIKYDIYSENKSNKDFLKGYDHFLKFMRKKKSDFPEVDLNENEKEVYAFAEENGITKSFVTNLIKIVKYEYCINFHEHILLSIGQDIK